jgi:hypothetical protein
MKQALAILAAITLSQTTAFAEQSRMSGLMDSSVISALGKRAEWTEEFSADRIDYVCQSCGGPANAVIEVVSLNPGLTFASFSRSYLSQRAKYCADLATSAAGRCESTDYEEVRFGILRGYVSQTELTDGSETEIAYFYQPGGHEREMIRAAVTARAGARVPAGTFEILKWYMRKLTVAW